MSFLERVDSQQKARVTITKMTETGSAFGVHEDDGHQVYFSQLLVRATGIEVGQSYETKVTKNNYRNSLTEWFGVWVDRRSALRNPLIEAVAAAVSDGTVWTGADLAEEMLKREPTEDEARLYDALADAAYNAGRCSKFLRFDAPNQPPVRAWYTSDPDAAEVDAWEDAE